MCNISLCKTPKQFFTTLKPMSSQPALLFIFKEKDASLNSFTDITFSGSVVTFFLMHSLKLLRNVPVSFVKFVSI